MKFNGQGRSQSSRGGAVWCRQQLQWTDCNLHCYVACHSGSWKHELQLLLSTEAYSQVSQAGCMHIWRWWLHQNEPLIITAVSSVAFWGNFWQPGATLPQTSTVQAVCVTHARRLNSMSYGVVSTRPVCNSTRPLSVCSMVRVGDINTSLTTLSITPLVHASWLTRLALVLSVCPLCSWICCLIEINERMNDSRSVLWS